MNNIDILDLTLFVINTFILYLLFYNMNSFTSKKLFYGVNINTSTLDKDTVKNIDKKYKKLTTLSLLFTFLVTFLLIYTNVLRVASIMIILFLALNFFVYVNARGSVLSLKDLTTIDTTNQAKSVVDMDLLSEKDTLIKKFKVLYSLLVLVSLILCIYSVINYPKVLDPIPTHWNFYGEADGFITKSLGGLISQLSIFFITTCLVSFISLNTLKSRVKLSVSDISGSKEEVIKFINRVGYSFFVVLLSLICLFTLTTLALFNGPNISTPLMIICGFTIIIGAIYASFVHLKSPNLKKDSSYSPDDEDRYWVWGVFYNNPNDPSFMVQKRFGIGWTVNIGSLAGKILMIIIGLILVFSIGMSIFL